MKIYSFTPILPVVIFAVARVVLAVVAVGSSRAQHDVLVAAANITDANGAKDAAHKHFMATVWQVTEMLFYILVLDLLRDVLVSYGAVQIMKFKTAIYATYQIYWIHHVKNSVEDLGIMSYAGQYVSVVFAVTDAACLIAVLVVRFGPENPRAMLAACVGLPIITYGLLRMTTVISALSKKLRKSIREMDDRARISSEREFEVHDWSFREMIALTIMRDWVSAHLNGLCCVPFVVVQFLAHVLFGLAGYASLVAEPGTARANYLSFNANGYFIIMMMRSIGHVLHSYSSWRSSGAEFESAMEKLEEHPSVFNVTVGIPGKPYSADGSLVIACLKSKPKEGFAVHSAGPIVLRPGFTLVSGPSGEGKSTMCRLFAGTMDEESLDLKLGDTENAEGPSCLTMNASETRSVATGVAAMNAIARDARVMQQKSGGSAMPKVSMSVEMFYGEHWATAREILCEFDMEKYACSGAKISKKELSGGQEDRLELARVICDAIAAGVGVVVLDEADAALDAMNCARFVRILEKWLAGVRIMIISHTKETASLIMSSSSYAGAYNVSGGTIART